MARVSILSVVLLIAVSTMEAQPSQNLYKVLLTQKGYIQASSAFQFIQSLIYLQQCFLAADHSGRAVSGMNCLRPLKYWDRGFESHLRHGCLCTFIPCVCCPVRVGSGLATG
jgi:hypothetical protein